MFSEAAWKRPWQESKSGCGAGWRARGRACDQVLRACTPAGKRASGRLPRQGWCIREQWVVCACVRTGMQIGSPYGGPLQITMPVRGNAGRRNDQTARTLSTRQADTQVETGVQASRRERRS